MNEVVGHHDLLMVTLDTLRYDVAAELAAPAGCPTSRAYCRTAAGRRGTRPAASRTRRTPPSSRASCPRRSARARTPRLFAARFGGSESTAPNTWVFEEADLPAGLARAGYHTACIGGVGFFNKQGALGSVLPGMFAESHWDPELGVTSPISFEAQVARAERVVGALDTDQRLFLLVNVAALHQPNWFHTPGATAADGDTRATHAAPSNTSTATSAACSAR